MRPHQILLAIFAILLIFLYFSKKTKEGFLNEYCRTYKDCTSCASASGCSWCPASKVCLDSRTLKSTDTSCNQMNTINSSFLCKAELSDEIPPEAVISEDIMYDFTLYKNQITDKIPPPNLYMNGDLQYTNEDVLSNINELRDMIQNYQEGLPGIVASSVVNNIQPMVKGILSENYYIQG